MEIKRSGLQPSTKGPNDWFILIVTVGAGLARHDAKGTKRKN